MPITIVGDLRSQPCVNSTRTILLQDSCSHQNFEFNVLFGGRLQSFGLGLQSLFPCIICPTPLSLSSWYAVLWLRTQTLISDQALSVLALHVVANRWQL